MFLEFAHAIRSRSEEGISGKLEDAYLTTASVIYADLAYPTKSSVAIDKNNIDITNNDQARAMLKRGYRHPFA